MTTSWWKPLLVGAVSIGVVGLGAATIAAVHDDAPAPRRPLVVRPVADSATPTSSPTQVPEDDHGHHDGGDDHGDHSGHDG